MRTPQYILLHLLLLAAWLAIVATIFGILLRAELQLGQPLQPEVGHWRDAEEPPPLPPARACVCAARQESVGEDARDDT